VPTPNEIEILSITKENKVVDKVLISHRMEISLDYAAHLLNYLVGKSLLEEVPAKGGLYRTLPKHKLTRMGAMALLQRLYHIAGEYESAARRVLYLKDVVDERINEMAGYIKEEFPENPKSSTRFKFEDPIIRTSRR